MHNLNIRKILLLGIPCLLAVLLIAGSMCILLDPYDNRILSNVTIGGMDVGGMDPVQAYRTLKQSSAATLESTPLSVEFPEATVELFPEDVNISLNCWSAVRAAYRVGRSDNPAYEEAIAAGRTIDIGLLPFLKIDQAHIQDVLDAYASQFDTDLIPSQYTLSGTMPDLELENTDAAGSCQTLEISLGIPTARLDREDALSRILAVYDSAFLLARQDRYRAFVDKVDILELPERPDIREIYNAVSVSAVNDSLDMKTYAVIPGAWGYDFDWREATRKIVNAQFGDTVQISMRLSEPEITGDNVYFRDVLGYCETPHTKDEKRNHNLRTACASMNGMILQPGDTFSYNQTLGERTKENGYLPAPAYSGWELVQSYGGGICQGSSTIYCAALYADLEIVHRVNHGMKVGYMDPGLDATVSWWGPDFQFRNNTNFPIKIAAEVSDGYVKVTILGTEERDYYVEMETEAAWGKDVLYAKSYKCKYDCETGELISRELEARSNYRLH